MKLRVLIADYVAFRQAMGQKFSGSNYRLHAFCRASAAMLMRGMSPPNECCHFLGVPRLATGMTSTTR
jgi:hypothetical protein